MIIPCPHCGKRYSTEFSYEGDATLSRPNGPVDNPETDWYNYVYARKNTVDNHHELWHHVAGCRQYIVVTRNLRNHDIIDVNTVAAFQANLKTKKQIKSQPEAQIKEQTKNSGVNS